MEDGVVSLSSNQGLLVIPRGRNGLAPLKIDMTEVYRAFNRIEEIKRCTPITAGDLITDFIVGMMRLSKAISLVELELREAQSELKEAQSICILDKVEPILADKKIKSTADTREAVLHLDFDVKNAKNRVDMLDTVSTYLRDTHSGLECAYNGAKKILDVYLKTPMGSGGYGEGDK